MRVLGIAASARRGGNSEILLDKALEGAASKGAKIEKVVINRLKIRPCQECAKCDKDGTCVIKDDMQSLYKKLEKADAIIIASPVYFGSVTAQLKAVIDRCQALWIKYFVLGKKRIHRVKRKGLFISVSGHSNRRFFLNSKEIVKLFFMVLGVKIVSELYVPRMEYAGEVLKKKPILDKVLEYGKRLVSPPR